MAQKGPTRTPQRAQGIGRMYAEQNKPTFTPKLPGVQFRHALARSAQRVHTACAGLSATETVSMCGSGVIYYIENIQI